MKRFTATDDTFIREHYATHTLREMGAELGRTEGSISERMKRLALVVPPEEQERRRRYTNINLTVGGIATRIRIGNVPVNKGKPISDEMRQLLRPTMFKPGNVPANHRPVGSERTLDGYVYIKTAEPRTWEPKHRWLWEQHNGKLQAGQVLKFIDGNKNNITLGNLRLTDRQRNILDNTIHNYPPELKQAVHSLGVIKRRINKVSKQLNKHDNEQ